VHNVGETFDEQTPRIFPGMKGRVSVSFRFELSDTAEKYQQKWWAL